MHMFGAGASVHRLRWATLGALGVSVGAPKAQSTNRAGPQLFPVRVFPVMAMLVGPLLLARST